MKSIVDMLDNIREVKSPVIAKYKYKYYKLLLNLLYPKKKHLKNGIDLDSNVIISLTSYGDRVNYVWRTIVTLLNQTKKPYKVMLWLCAEEFDSDINKLPKELVNLIQYGLEIRFCKNLYPHKKYFYTVKEYEDKDIITVDDDTLYPETLVEELTGLSKKYPNTVCCTYAQRIELDNEGKLTEYRFWGDDTERGCKPDIALLPIGCGGVLYPKHIFHGTDLLNEDLIMENCPYTDDLWLKVNAMRNGIKAVRIDKKFLIYFSILKAQKMAMERDNIGNHKNDIAMDKLMKLYPECMEMLTNACNSNNTLL